MKKIFTKDFVWILKVFLVWRAGLFVVAFGANYLIPKFGASFPYWDRVLTVTGLPNWIWGFGNFDGPHYLRIAQNGYDAEFTNAFFPLFPLLVRALASVFPSTQGLDLSIYVDPRFFWAGTLIVTLSTIAFMFIFYKLLKLDLNEVLARRVIFLTLLFPTSFYLVSIYTESLFFLFVVATLYLIRKERFLYASVFIALASLTKVIGIFLLLVYFIELVRAKKLKPIYLSGILIGASGLMSYMFYLFQRFNDPLYFFHVQSLFGAERSGSSLILLPQVIYRYFKILTTLVPSNYAFRIALIELLFTSFAFTTLFAFIKKIKVSYFLFIIIALIIPTLTGTLSSMPRYVLPIILLFPYLVQSSTRKFYIISFVFGSVGVVLLSLFVRGYWVS